MSAIPAKTRRMVELRSDSLCEGCGERPATEIHHRQYRSRGGSHGLENLIHLCGSGNHSGCHGTAHSAEGHELGWSVHSWDDPRDEPVLYRGTLRWLTAWGSAVDVGPDHPF
jgi:5-methylcytosine-specific restriction endonuclease McrA